MVDKEQSPSGFGKDSERDAHESLIRVYESALHDIKTPLAIISMHLSGLRLSLRGDSKRKSERAAIKAAENCCKDISAIMRDAALRAMGAGTGFSPVLRLCDAAALAESVVNSVRTLSDSKGIKLSYCPETAMDAVLTDQGLFQRILMNLLSNAVKFTPEGGSVNVFLKAADGLVTLRVEDTGAGFTVHSTEQEADKAPGSGIGLTIVRDMARALGGGVEARNVETGGAVVTVTLPNKAKKAREEAVQITLFN